MELFENVMSLNIWAFYINFFISILIAIILILVIIVLIQFIIWFSRKIALNKETLKIKDMEDKS